MYTINYRLDLLLNSNLIKSCLDLSFKLMIGTISKDFKPKIGAFHLIINLDPEFLLPFLFLFNGEFDAFLSLLDLICWFILTLFLISIVCPLLLTILNGQNCGGFCFWKVYDWIDGLLSLLLPTFAFIFCSGNYFQL